MLSVIIIAKNEEANIRRCLESVQWADQIVVLDSGSVDNTFDIAKEFTPEVFKTDWKGYGVQKQRALSCAKHDWVLNIDADEVVDVGLKHEILDAIDSDVADAYRIPIRMIFYGKQLQYSASPTRHIRLFKREGARYSADTVHEKVLMPDGARVEQLRLPILHQSYRDITHAMYKINRYSSYSARERLKKNQRGNLFKTFFATNWMFFRCFVLQRGFMDGQEGLIMALIKAQGTMMRGLKQIYPDRPLRRRTPPDKARVESTDQDQGSQITEDTNQHAQSVEPTSTKKNEQDINVASNARHPSDSKATNSTDDKPLMDEQATSPSKQKHIDDNHE